jgi:hypothetical protein
MNKKVLIGLLITFISIRAIRPPKTMTTFSPDEISHLSDGKYELNFSLFKTYPLRKQIKKIGRIG